MVIHVPGDHLAIQDALTAATSGDTILVAAGIYIGPGNRNLTFHGKALALIGAGASSSIIDCEGRGRGFIFRENENREALLKGFSIMDAVALGTGSAGKGAGIYCGGASPIIESCILMMCEAWYGGGLAAEGDARPALLSCLILDNVARLDGGGVYYLSSGGSLADCSLTGNSASGQGADAYLYGASPVFERCRFQTPPASPMILLDTSR
ncbi:MAG: hypothetical protein GY835_10935 [bacterium]|nr:hypothetical protein [bacterium]